MIEKTLIKRRMPTAVTYYPLKKQRSDTDRPSIATTDGGDENAFTGPNRFNCAVQTGLMFNGRT